MDLQKLFTEEEIRDAFKQLKSRACRKKFEDELSGRFDTRKELNSLGKFLNRTTQQEYYASLKTFELDSYQGLAIKKSNGQFRPLLIPSPKDRVVLAAAFPKLFKRMESRLKKYKALGLGLNKKSEIGEMKRVLEEIRNLIIKNGDCFVLKLDFKDFFSSIKRRSLMKKTKVLLGRENDKLSAFLSKSINNGIKADAIFWDCFKSLKLDTDGIPQGLSYSPLLASFYAIPLDAKMREGKLRSYRYLDDMIVIAKSKNKIESAYKQIEIVSKSLGMRLHPLSAKGKTQIIEINETGYGFTFLGVEVRKDKLKIPDKAIAHFQEIVREEIVTDATIKKYTLNEIIETYKKFATGWTSHYRSLCPQDFEDVSKRLDLFLRNHIEKRRHPRAKFFGSYRLITKKPFLEII